MKRLEYEREVSLALVNVLYESKGNVIHSEIIKSSAEFMYLSSIVNNGGNGEIVTRLQKAFHVNFSDAEFNEQMLGTRMFVKLSIPELKEFLINKNLPTFRSNMVDENFTGEISIEEGS